MNVLKAHKPSTPIDWVDVYFNRYKRVWSCRCRKKGVVVHHSPVVIASYGGDFIVQDGGRKRVLREKRKNVHAFARIDHGLISKDLAEWTAFADTLHGKIEVSYNPYRGGSFYRKDTGADVQRADALIMLAPLDAAPIVWAVVDL